VNLLEALKNNPPRLFIGFSSVVARFGNAGQMDYAAANDMLGRLIQRWQTRWPHTLFKTMDWTAWDEVGMAARGGMKTVLESRGLAFLPVGLGIRLFTSELGVNMSGESVFTAYNPDFDPDGLFDAGLSGMGPFLDPDPHSKADGAFVRVLDPVKDRFLKDHARHQVPIFLGATGMETLGEAAVAASESGKQLLEIKNFSIPYGIKILKGRPKEIQIQAQKRDNESGWFDCRIISVFRHPSPAVPEKLTEHYKASCRTGQTFPPPKSMDLAMPPAVSGGREMVDWIYHPDRLFMEGRFLSMKEVMGFDSGHLVTRVADPGNPPLFLGRSENNMVLNVALVDAMFQSAGLYQVLTNRALALPSDLESAQFFRPLVKGVSYFCHVMAADTDPASGRMNLVLADDNGNPAVSIKNFTMVQVDRADVSNAPFLSEMTSPSRKVS
jgi:hypothetical protein